MRGVALDKRGSWSISLHNGTEVVLGRSDPEARLERFAPLLPRLVACDPGQRLARADLRYTNGFSADLGRPAEAAENHCTTPQPLAMASRGVPSPSPLPQAGEGAVRRKSSYNRKGDKSLIVGLDIGTSKVTALVGDHAPGEPIEVIGIGSTNRAACAAAWWSTSTPPCSRSSARSRKPS